VSENPVPEAQRVCTGRVVGIIKRNWRQYCGIIKKSDRSVRCAPLSVICCRRLVTFGLRFDSHRGSFASNLEQDANLLCAQVNSASYPQRDGKWVVAQGQGHSKFKCLTELLQWVEAPMSMLRLCLGQLSLLRSAGWKIAYGLWGKGLVWLIGAVVCLLAANCGSNCSLMRVMDDRIVHCGIISSCQSAATSEIVKHFWSRTHVRSAITSIWKIWFIIQCTKTVQKRYKKIIPAYFVVCHG